jgi:Family of unknown function (DUF6812)
MLSQGTNGRQERRVERVQFETSRQIIVGDVTLPPEGYQSRFSDSMNRPDIAFIPVVDAEITPAEGGETVRRNFVVVGKEHVQVAFPVESVRPARSPIASTGA